MNCLPKSTLIEWRLIFHFGKEAFPVSTFKNIYRCEVNLRLHFFSIHIKSQEENVFSNKPSSDEGTSNFNILKETNTAWRKQEWI